MLVTIDFKKFPYKEIQNKLIIKNDKYQAILVKNITDENSWLLSGYELWKKTT